MIGDFFVFVIFFVIFFVSDVQWSRVVFRKLKTCHGYERSYS